MYLFLIPLLLGFAFAGASAFTAYYSKLWGERGGQLATIVLRNLLGIPLAFIGFVIAWRTPAPHMFSPNTITIFLGWLLIIGGSIPVIVGHIEIGLPTHMPSVKDKLVRTGLYVYVRHPIYAGMLLVIIGLALLHPTSIFLAAWLLCSIFFFVQARLEEIDLMQRMPDYRQYMKEVPRFIPRIRGR